MGNVFKHTRVMWLFLVSMVLATSGCKRTAEKTSEKIIEEAIGDNAKVDLDQDKVVIQTEEGTFTSDANVHSWPKEVPSDIPEFDEGEVISVTTQEMEGNKNWVVLFEEVPGKALQEYKKALEEKGFKINYTTMAGAGGHLAAEKDKIRMMVMVGEGNASVTIGVDQ